MGLCAARGSKVRTRGDSDIAQQLAQLLVIAHSQLDVAGDDTGLLVVAGSVACQLQHLHTTSRLKKGLDTRQSKLPS